MAYFLANRQTPGIGGPKAGDLADAAAGRAKATHRRIFALDQFMAYAKLSSIRSGDAIRTGLLLPNHL